MEVTINCNFDGVEMTREEIKKLAEQLAECLEDVAGLRKMKILKALWTLPSKPGEAHRIECRISYLGEQLCRNDSSGSHSRERRSGRKRRLWDE